MDIEQIVVIEIVAQHDFDKVVARHAFAHLGMANIWADGAIKIQLAAAKAEDPSFDFYSFVARETIMPFNGVKA